MKKIFLTTALCIAIYTASNPVMAQKAGSALYSIQYSVSYATGDLKDYIAKTSFRGVSIDFRKMINDNVFAGLEFGWNVFYEKLDYATQTEGTVTVTGTQYRYVSTFPMLVNIGYSKNTSANMTVYGDLGIGTIYHRTRLDIGIWEFSNEAWHFALKPELGFIYKPGPDLGILVNGKYYSGFETKDTKAITYISTNVGFIWIF